MTQFIFLKNPFSTQIKQTASRTKSTRAQSIISERLPVQQDLQRAALEFVVMGQEPQRPWPLKVEVKGDGDRALQHSPWPSKGEPSSPINKVGGLSLQGQASELVNHRLLTSKLGGWGHGPSSGGESMQQLHHQGERRGARQMFSLHAASRTLPSHLIKLVNQLMRHGKKGLSIGLLADSLTLFLKRLEEGGRSNLRNNPFETTILSQQMGRQGGIQSREGMIQPKGVPSFPFYLTSFPGARLGDMFSLGNGQSNTLLGLPFSGTLPPDPSNIRLSFLKKDGKYRGSLGFEMKLNLDAGKDQSLPVFFDIPLFASAPAFWAGSRNRRSINLKTWIAGKKQNSRSRSHLSRVEVGLRSHTQKPIYFWHMESSPVLPLCLNPPESVKVQRRFSPPQPRLIGREGIAPQASILDLLSRAIAHVEPSLEVRKKKIAGITRQIPCVVSKSRGEKLAIRWIINSAREKVKKRGKGLPYCLAEELTDAYHKRGEPRQKRDSLHKVAESNRSFLRYRWW